MSLTPFLEVSEALSAMGGESLYDCMQCGLCSGLCPWSDVDSVFRTRKLIRMAQMGLEGFESDDILYACTNCKLCEINCPRAVKITEVVKAMRGMIAETGAIPSSLRPIIGSIHSQGNPWSGPVDDRISWASDLDVPLFDGNQEYLLFVCCTSAYEKRSQNIAKSISKILNKVGITFGIMGNDESCCGEALSRIGDQDEFLKLVDNNLGLWKKNGVKKIITTSPHSFLTFNQDYINSGVDFEILHYVQLFDKLLKERKIKISDRYSKKVIYHDPCYLGRHSEIYDEPRNILNAILKNDLLEYDRNFENSLCCGGGGGRLWMETSVENRFSTYKIRQAYEKQAEVVATCCPYCISMLTDSLKSENLDEKIEVLDLSELLSEVI